MLRQKQAAPRQVAQRRDLLACDGVQLRCKLFLEVEAGTAVQSTPQLQQC